MSSCSNPHNYPRVQQGLLPWNKCGASSSRHHDEANHLTGRKISNLDYQIKVWRLFSRGPATEALARPISQSFNKAESKVREQEVH